MNKKDRLIDLFGNTLGVFLFLFSLFSFPLAVYGISKAFSWGIIGGVFVALALHVIIPFGELLSLGFALFGLLKLFS